MTDQDDEIRELKERLARLEQPSPHPQPGLPPPQAKSGSGCGTFIGLGAVLIVGFFMVSMCNGDSGEVPGVVETASWTPPPGYYKEPTTRGGGIATEWEKPTRSECRGSGVTCFAINVVTERDCPRSLYASITLLDATGNNIGWTNDTAQGVQAGEKTRLVFDTYERGAESARLAEINCY